MKFSLKELSDAIIKNKGIIIKYYLKSDGNPDFADYNGYSLLHQAAKYKRLVIIKDLIQAGANINAKMDGYKTPLNMLLDAPPKFSTFGMVVNGSFRFYKEQHKIPDNKEFRYEVAQYLLESGANANQVKSDGQITGFELHGFRTPLMQAAILNDIKIISLLTEFGANVNESDYYNSTALNEAVNKAILR